MGVQEDDDIPHGQLGSTRAGPDQPLALSVPVEAHQTAELRDVGLQLTPQVLCEQA